MFMMSMSIPTTMITRTSMNINMAGMTMTFLLVTPMTMMRMPTKSMITIFMPMTMKMNTGTLWIAPLPMYMNTAMLFFMPTTTLTTLNIRVWYTKFSVTPGGTGLAHA